MRNSISEHITHRTLKQMGYSCRKPHWVAFPFQFQTVNHYLVLRVSTTSATFVIVWAIFVPNNMARGLFKTKCEWNQAAVVLVTIMC